MRRNTLKWLILGGLIRTYLVNSEVGTIMANRVEIATPLNSFKKAQEGIYLLKHNIDPYAGDMVHEIPLMLWLLWHATNLLQGWLPLLYVMLDLMTAIVLYKASQLFVRKKLSEQSKELEHYAAGTEDLQYQTIDELTMPRCVLLAYLFNPLALFNCAGLTCTIFSNFLLSMALYGLVDRRAMLFSLCVALEAMRNMYPIVLLAPAVLVFGKKQVKPIVYFLFIFISTCMIICWLNYKIVGNWRYLDGTLGFIFFYRDLQPNIGLFWYFFTEMFEHFRTLFLITFQMNATILYMLPLTMKVRKEPILLTTILIGLMSIFRAYPCLGDVSFYIALLPLWKRSLKFMAHNFVVFCLFLVSLCILPTLWHLWIYSGSANANFYFGATLAFSTGQIFLITDLLYAQVKREFCLYHGLKIVVDGKDAKIVLG
uniref:Phosphatidylinositol glycan anchor biosynthesis class U protein n=1 Tax=Glossina austeni TaxID=7395 RepID=A0A1A9UMZ6_GLOAU